MCGNQHNVRVLLGFLEDLEKTIYNAGEGSAFALPLADKPVRLFFHVNAPTCREWFTRCRTAVALVALHSMEPEQVVRYGETVLAQLARNKRTGDALFEHTLMSTTWALLRCAEADTLNGLYVWSKTVSGRQFPWIRAAADQATGRREAAQQAYAAILDADGVPLDAHIRDFIADQMAACLDAQQEWQALLMFQVKERAGATRATMPLACKTREQLVGTSLFRRTADVRELCDTEGVMKLALGDWEVLDGIAVGGAAIATPSGEAGGGASTTKMLGGDLLSHPRLLAIVENTLSECIINSALQPAVVADKLRKCRMFLIGALQECLRTGVQEHVAQLTVLSHVCHKVLHMHADETNGRSGSNGHIIDTLQLDRTLQISASAEETLSRVLGWSELLHRRAQLNGAKSSTGVPVEAGGDACLQRIRLDAASLARKNGNLRRCEHLLQEYFVGIRSSSGGINVSSSASTLTDICEQLASQPVDGSAGLRVDTVEMARGLYETAKWMHEMPERRADAVQFAAAAVLGISTRTSLASVDDPDVQTNVKELHDKAARCLLRLSDWIQGKFHCIVCIVVY